ncbi:alpha/beta hydrolase [Actinomyces minihominis]|uniref:alpha/beta hydrolase n=1 Tax=Actinomyces minihominis TaxID=2002838 RepID=UPI000C073B9B|nr:alpha/beta hydrolase [Actinomyces minihominis]
MSSKHSYPELFSAPAPLTEPRGTVLLAHGFGEHRGRYTRFITALNEAGYDVWSFDFTGHGTTSGRRATVDVRKLIGEHIEVRREVLKLARTPELLLFGHSMGGLITLASTLINPTRVVAVAVTGPALAPRPPVASLVASLGARVGALLPWVKTVSLDTNLLSRDPEVISDYEADSLVFHGRVPLLTGASMATQGRQTIDHAKILARPVLILHGEADGLADVAGSIEFAENAADLVEIRTFEGAYHELLNEPEQGIYTEAVIDWYNRWS